MKRLRPAPPPSRALGLPAAVVSVALHVALVALALAPPFTTTGSDHAGADESAQLLYPLLRPQPRPVEEHVSYVGLGGDAAIEVPVGRKDESPSRLPAEMPAEAPAPVPVPEEAPHTYSEIEVDSAAIRDPSSVGPVYPQKLLEAHVEGGTLVRFVVDSTGRVDPTSIVVLETTHEAFAQAVRDVLPRMKYQPARMGQHHVAQLVEQRFGFRITPPLS